MHRKIVLNVYHATEKELFGFVYVNLLLIISKPFFLSVLDKGAVLITHLHNLPINDRIKILLVLMENSIYIFPTTMYQYLQLLVKKSMFK